MGKMDGQAKLVRLRRPKITCSPLYVDYRPKKCSNIIGHGSYTKGRQQIGGIGKGNKTKNLNVVDVLTI
jgi:hypothetical protein